MKYFLGILITLIIILIGAVSYLVGRQSSSLPILATPSQSNDPQVACTMEAKLCPDGSSVARTGPKCEFAPCPALKIQKVEGGGVLSFPRYALTIPSDWTIKREIPGPDSERLILSGKELGITILQGGFGGSVCLFPGDADSEGPSAHYTSYVEIVNQSGDHFRRVTPENGKGYGLCQLTQYGWGAPTLYGAISLKTPASPTPADLVTIDQILISLTKL